MSVFKHKSDVRIEGTLLLPNETASRALIINGSGELDTSAVTSTELGYVSGVTSAIQTQLNAKLNLSGGTMSGAIAMGTNKITGLGDPTLAQDAATKNYVDTVAQGLSWKQYVRAATTANITIATALNAGDVIDGVTLAADDRVLVKNQSAPEENGIYVVGASPARSSDMDSWVEVVSAAVFVSEGTANGDKGFVCTSDAGGTLGTTAINFAQFSNVLYTADGQGIELSGNQFSLELDGSTLSKSASGLKVATGGITNTEVNAAAAIAYSKLNLSDSIVNADINSAAAIAYSKLNLSASIVNADVATGAAIARNKLASGTANHVVINDGSGVMSSEAQLSVSRGGTGVDGSAVTNGQLLIGHDANNNFSLATLTAGTNISITNGAGSITINATGNANDIPDTAFAGNEGQTNASITGFAFANANVRGFEALASVSIDATADLFEVFTLRGVQKGASWDMSVTSTGDDSLVSFSITAAGQIQYTSSTYAGFVSLDIQFRAITNAI